MARIISYSSFSLTILLAGHLTLAFIDTELVESLASSQDNTADVLINFAGGNSQVIKNIESKSFPDADTKAKELCSSLQSLTSLMQDPVVKVLGQLGVKSQSFWSSNQMVIRNASPLILQTVDIFPQVARIQRLPTVTLDPLPSSVAPATNEPVQWGVAKIEAHEAWTTTRGKGVVVCNIDTGVRRTHEALASNHRTEHGWHDPYSTNTSVPDDGNGHGTHTMGTICGQGGIGVAPDAQWIACRGCGSSTCEPEQLLACGQWCMAPGNDPTKRPDVISCSWGSAVGGSDWYTPTILAWAAAGILHAFAIGNSGPVCQSGGSPGDQKVVFSVGSTDSNDALSIFSSKGPVFNLGKLESYMKPDVCAPGSNVMSAWHTGDTVYNTISGTSMATPHVAGAIALLIANKRMQTGDSKATLTQAEVVTLLTGTTDKNLTMGTGNTRCGADLVSGSFPNNNFGAGRINANTAVDKLTKGSSEQDNENEKGGSKSTKSCFGVLGFSLFCLG